MRSNLTIALLSSFFVAGCGLGSEVIRSERVNYNRAIHDTSAEQLLLNIIRTKSREAPVFSEFAEYDSSPSAGFSIAGGSSTIGIIPTLGMLSPSLTASETVLQKNLLLTGAQLTQQISSPITLRSIRRLSLAAEPLVPLYRLTFSRIGPFVDYNRVINTLNFLDLYGAFDIDTRNDNTMTISFAQKGALTTSTVPADQPTACLEGNSRSSKFVIDRLWKVLTQILPTTDGQIVLRISEASIAKDKTDDLSVAKMRPPATLVSTGTALGALRQTITDDHTFSFMTHEAAVKLRTENLGPGHCFNGEFYLQAYDADDRPGTKPIGIAEQWQILYRFPFQAEAEARRNARQIGASTILFIIETGSVKPDGAYVAVQKDGIWYSIDNGDQVTKQNFGLLGNIENIQAAPSNNTPTPTTISANR